MIRPTVYTKIFFIYLCIRAYTDINNVISWIFLFFKEWESVQNSALVKFIQQVVKY